MPEKPAPPPSAPRREKRLELRLDQELFDEFTRQAADYGGASIMIRVLMRKFSEGKVAVSQEEIRRELLPAFRRRHKGVKG